MSDRLRIRDRSLVLRILVPGLKDALREKIQELEDDEQKKDSFLDLEGVSCEPTTARNHTLWHFHCDGATYPARLVNLPCPVELHKTHDHAAYYKCGDIAQMLIVYEDENALEEAEEKGIDGFPSYYHSGLTPPMRRVVKRFASRVHPAVVPPRAAVQEAEMEIIKMMERVAAADKKGKKNKNKPPTLNSANKVLEEVIDEIVDYEPWMDKFGTKPEGVEFDSDDRQMCNAHPEVWLSAETIAKLTEAQRAEENKKKAKKKKKKQEEVAVPFAAAEMNDVDESANLLVNGEDEELDLDLFGMDFDDEDVLGLQGDDIDLVG